MRVQLAQPNQTEICQVRGAIGVARPQRLELRPVVVAVERNRHETIVHHAQDEPDVLQVERGLREDGLAGQEWLRDLFRDRDGPVVVSIVAICEGHQETSIRDASHEVEKPRRPERSRGPFTVPASDMNRRSDPAMARSSCSRTIRLCATPARVAVSRSHSACCFVRRTVSV